MPPPETRSALRGSSRTVAPAVEERLAASISRMLDSSNWRLVLWDGRATGPEDGAFTLTLRSPRALDRLVGALPDRGFGRAYVAGELDVEPIRPFLEHVGPLRRRHLLATWPQLVRTAVAVGARPHVQPAEAAEARLRGRRHSRERDSAAVRHHYDVPVDFYRLWLDSSLTYSCAYYATTEDTLEAAQAAKLDIVCRKLRLQPGERLLDVGCGWGSLLAHSARHYGVHASGITLSPPQAEQARATAREQQLEERIDARVADYRDHLGGPYDAIASIGMVEHVGERRMDEYVTALYRSLRPGGRLLLHGITSPADSESMRGSFVDAFHFPDSEVPEVGSLISRLHRAGFEVRDVENLREHYALTLDEWCRRMEARLEEVTAIAGPQRTRVWRLSMTASSMAFTSARRSLHQILAVRNDASGRAPVPLRREDWYGSD
ncbi:MAG: class I SAM-dependent methyltransferase [Candidatus Dormibacteria bacterium]